MEQKIVPDCCTLGSEEQRAEKNLMAEILKAGILIWLKF